MNLRYVRFYNVVFSNISQSLKIWNEFRKKSQIRNKILAEDYSLFANIIFVNSMVCNISTEPVEILTK